MLIQRKAATNVQMSSPMNSRFSLSVLQPSDVGADLMEAWSDLERRAADPNAFLSPYFVMPAIQHLESGKNILMLFVERECSGIKDLVGVAIFKIQKPTRKFPLPHLLAFETVHSYLSGFLIDKDHTDRVLELIYGYVTNSNQPWHGLKVNNVAPDLIFSTEGNMLAKERGMNWTTLSTWHRAVAYPAEQNEQILSSLSKQQQKNYRKRLRGLEEIGRVDWYLVSGEESLERSADEFIRLEHMGWKGEEGTSLYSNPDHTRFFRDVVAGFNREKRVYFTELALNDRTISSTSNLISGRGAFAFKIGWDPTYTKFSPGILNEIQFMERLNSLSDLEFVDSCAEPNSYLNELWTGRREIIKGIYTFTKLGQLALNFVGSIMNVKRAFFGGKKVASMSFYLVFEFYLNELAVILTVSQWVLQ